MVKGRVDAWSICHGYSVGRRRGFYDGTGVVLACGMVNDE